MNDRQLSDIRRINEQTVRLLQTINSNILALHRAALEAVDALKKMQTELTRDIDLDKLVEDSKKIAEAGKNFEKIVDANGVELPAEVEPSESYKIMSMDGKNDVERFVPDGLGRLFPHEWRHNLGMDVLPEDVRALHQPHENHPMTEEAFLIYNAGLVSEFLIKERKDEQQ